jgi:hypothetical protein
MHIDFAARVLLTRRKLKRRVVRLTCVYILTRKLAFPSLKVDSSWNISVQLPPRHRSTQPQ